MWKGSDNAKKTRRLDKDEIKKQLIESMINNDIIETNELNKKAEEVQKPEDAPAVIKKYEEIIRTNKKGIIVIVYHQGKVFKKFNDKEKFVKLVNEFKVHKGTTTFKINIYKLCEKYPKLMKSSIGVGFLKNYYKDIKEFVAKMQKSFHNYLLSSLHLFSLGGNELRKLF